MPLAISLAIGAVVQFLIPCPEGITHQAWSLLSLFVTTIAGKPRHALTTRLFQGSSTELRNSCAYDFDLCLPATLP